MITDGITLYVLGKLAIIVFNDIIANYEWEWTTVATLEEQYRPSARYKSSLKGERSNGDGVFYSVPVQLNTNGTLQLNPGSNAKLHIDGELVYFMGQFSISQYSTTETSTGQTWIDGKPIYRKVIKFGAMTGNNRYTIAHGVSYDTIVSFSAIARNSANSYLPLARVGYNSDSQIDASLNGYAYITPDNAIIIGGSQTNYTGATVIIEYTKA